MKTMFICFVVLCTLLVNVNCKITLGALLDNGDICMKETGHTRDQVQNPKVDTTCFEFCMMKRLTIIEDNQINLQKFEELTKILKPRREVQPTMNAARQCTELMPVLEDNCESFAEIKNCLNEKTGQN